MKNKVNTEDYEAPEWPVKPQKDDKVIYYMKDEFELQRTFRNYLNYRDKKKKEIENNKNNF